MTRRTPARPRSKPLDKDDAPDAGRGTGRSGRDDDYRRALLDLIKKKMIYIN